MKRERITELDNLQSVPWTVTHEDLNDHEKPFSFNLTCEYIWNHLTVLNIDVSYERVMSLANTRGDELWMQCYTNSPDPYTITRNDLSNILDDVLDVKKRWIDNPDGTTGKKIPEFYIK